MAILYENQYEVTCMETKKSIVICKINCSTFSSFIIGYTSRNRILRNIINASILAFISFKFKNIKTIQKFYGNIWDNIFKDVALMHFYML